MVYDFPMRTNVVLDDELVQEAMLLTGLKTKRAVIHEALKSLVLSKKHKSLFDLEGRIRFRPGYDHKALREGS